ncbi:DUF3102 domain-containing protein [Ruegeria atlantica]|uniref:DUF3102 domain-containing protein n=1 Tax=Ruegeria atlantica TaxID=81569 RepID=UPI001481A3F7
MDIGEELIAVKAELKHGAFKPWVTENCSFAYRCATDYMQVARAKSAERRTFDACSSIREVLAIGKTKAAPKPDIRAATLDDLREVERLRALTDNPAATEGALWTWQPITYVCSVPSRFNCNDTGCTCRGLNFIWPYW